MPKPISDEANIRICCRVRRTDLDYLKRLARTNSELGYNMLIRNIVADYVKRLRDLERQNNDRQGTPRIEITEDDLASLEGLGEPEPVEELKLEL
jgi:hypothetical protein